MADSSTHQSSAPSLTKEQEAMESAPNFDQPQAMPYVPGAIPPAYSFQPPGGAAQAAYVPGMGQPITIIPQQMMVVEPKDIVSDYRAFAFVIMVIFAVLGTPSLIFSIPAVIIAFKSRIALKEGRVQDAKTLSITSAYLSTVALIVGFIVFSLIIILPVSYRIQIAKSIDGYPSRY